MTPKQLEDIRRVSELRFGAELAPDALGGYLEQEDGVYKVVRLPAEDDPMLQRIGQVRVRERMFIDVLDGHYERFCGDMRSAYSSWRDAAGLEAKLQREVKRSEYVGCSGFMELACGFGVSAFPDGIPFAVRKI